MKLVPSKDGSACRGHARRVPRMLPLNGSRKFKLTIRNIPLDQGERPGCCIWEFLRASFVVAEILSGQIINASKTKGGWSPASP